MLRALDLERLIGRRRCRERDLVVAMVCQRLLARARSSRRRGASRPRRSPTSSSWARLTRPSCWPPWTGWWRAKTASRAARTPPPPPAEGVAFSLRPLLELPRRTLLPAGDTGLLARWCEGQAAGQLRADLLAGGPPHGCARARGQPRRLADPARRRRPPLREHFGIEDVVFIGDRGMVTKRARQTFKADGVTSSALCNARRSARS